MRVFFENNNFCLNSKTEFKDESGKLLYYGIYDFSYKGRIRFIDYLGNEVAYLQFNILSGVDEVVLFNNKNERLAYVKINDKNILYPDSWLMKDDGIYLKNERLFAIKNNYLEVDEANILKALSFMYCYKNIKE